MVDLSDFFCAQPADPILQSAAVNGAKLFQKSNRCLGELAYTADGDMSWQKLFIGAAGDGADDGGGAVAVAHIVL